MVSMYMKNDILSLKRRGMSNRKIALELNISKDTVNKYVKEMKKLKKLIELNYGNKSLHALLCPKCSHTKKRGVLYPKYITDLDGNPITYQDVLNCK